MKFLNAHFVGYNHEAAVSNLFEDIFGFSKPCFYCTNHSWAKISIPYKIYNTSIFTLHCIYYHISTIISFDLKDIQFIIFTYSSFALYGQLIFPQVMHLFQTHCTSVDKPITAVTDLDGAIIQPSVSVSPMSFAQFSTGNSSRCSAKFQSP